MEVLEDIIVKVMGLDMEGINFYHDRKLSDRAIDEFMDSAKERNRLVKISNSYYNLASVSRSYRFVLFVIIEYLTLDGHFTKLYGYHFMLVNHFRHSIRLNFLFYLR